MQNQSLISLSLSLNLSAGCAQSALSEGLLFRHGDELHINQIVKFFRHGDEPHSDETTIKDLE